MRYVAETCFLYQHQHNYFFRTEEKNKKKKKEKECFIISEAKCGCQGFLEKYYPE